MYVFEYVTAVKNAPDLTCAFANLALFTTVQCVFFVFIASKQYEILIADKLQILVDFLNGPSKDVSSTLRGGEKLTDAEFFNTLQQKTVLTQDELSQFDVKNLYAGTIAKAESSVDPKYFQPAERFSRRMVCKALNTLVGGTRWKPAGQTKPEGKEVYEPMTAEEKSAIDATFLPKVNTFQEFDVSMFISFKQAVSVTTEAGVHYFVRVETKFDRLLKTADQNKKDNISTIHTWCDPYMIVFSSLTILFAIRSFMNKGHWKSHHTFGMKLVTACFLTEVVYFFGVFKTFQVVGDWEIIEKIVFRKFQAVDATNKTTKQSYGNYLAQNEGPNGSREENNTTKGPWGDAPRGRDEKLMEKAIVDANEEEFDADFTTAKDEVDDPNVQWIAAPSGRDISPVTWNPSNSRPAPTRP